MLIVLPFTLSLGQVRTDTWLQCLLHFLYSIWSIHRLRRLTLTTECPYEVDPSFWKHTHVILKYPIQVRIWRQSIVTFLINSVYEFCTLFLRCHDCSECFHKSALSWLVLNIGFDLTTAICMESWYHKIPNFHNIGARFTILIGIDNMPHLVM